MRWHLLPICAAVCACALAACEREAESRSAPAKAQMPSAALPGGQTTFIAQNPLTALSAGAFSQAAANLPASARGQFAVGNSFFTQPWVSAPASTAARDGLGPLFSAAACQDCHLHDGRGHPPAQPDEPLRAAVVRLRRTDGSPDPVYGSQIQPMALPGLLPEASVRVRWSIQRFAFPDGSTVTLRRPELQLSDWAYGPPAPDTQATLLVAPQMIGLGLLEAIADSDIKAQAARQPELGLAGVANRVPNLETGKTSLGRFGWKAAQPSVRQQSLDAFVNDLGITSELFAADTCTDAQPKCAKFANGGTPELPPHLDAAVTFYASHLAPPARRDHANPDVRKGQALFDQLGCADCHRPSWQTANHPGSAALSNQSIWPYTDLLLHDMGPGLAGAVSAHDAGPRQWRTPPLWGLGHAKTVGGPAVGYLHDGRARTLVEAIAWHGGEAKTARDAWVALPAAERRLVIRFLASL